MTLTEKIARLVAEKGWNQDVFARHAGLNRNTARHILLRPDKRLRNQTIRQIADALGVPVHDLLEEPLQRLLSRIRDDHPPTVSAQRLLELATQPELQTWMARHPERARSLSEAEVDELLSLQGTGGPLTQFGVEHFVQRIERRRALQKKIETIAGTEYLTFLEQIVELLHEKVQPFRENHEVGRNATSKRR